ncbi:MAG: Piwi domain-containing protein, partial [Linnemannia gamsii]
PARILFKRDGVFEGEFTKVLHEEVGAIRSALRKFNISCRIQKRHNARPFPAQRELVDQSDNCQSGTVVDAGILHALGFDFYLHSHTDPIGTSRQAHCNVLRDDN